MLPHVTSLCLVYSFLVRVGSHRVHLYEQRHLFAHMYSKKTRSSFGITFRNLRTRSGGPPEKWGMSKIVQIEELENWWKPWSWKTRSGNGKSGRVHPAFCGKLKWFPSLVVHIYDSHRATRMSSSMNFLKVAKQLLLWSKQLRSPLSPPRLISAATFWA